MSHRLSNTLNIITNIDVKFLSKNLGVLAGKTKKVKPNTLAAGAKGTSKCREERANETAAPPMTHEQRANESAALLMT